MRRGRDVAKGTAVRNREPGRWEEDHQPGVCVDHAEFPPTCAVSLPEAAMQGASHRSASPRKGKSRRCHIRHAIPSGRRVPVRASSPHNVMHRRYRECDSTHMMKGFLDPSLIDDEHSADVCSDATRWPPSGYMRKTLRTRCNSDTLPSETSFTGAASELPPSTRTRAMVMLSRPPPTTVGLSSTSNAS